MTDSATDLNKFEQVIGYETSNWKEPATPSHAWHKGQYCELVPLQSDHSIELFEAFAHGEDSQWTYLSHGPFNKLETFENWTSEASKSEDPMFFCVIDRATKRAAGVTSLMRIKSIHGVLEIGNVHFSPIIQGTPASTEAHYLLLKHAFKLGYRRVEWKCDSHNAPSRRAAKRLGFTYEGLFRQAIVYKNRNRDTAWFSMLDSEWAQLQNAYTQWLAPENFDEDGQQHTPLVTLI